MNMADSEAKKKWDKQNMVFVAFKLFRSIGEKQNDQALIDYLDGKVKGDVIKKSTPGVYEKSPGRMKGEDT